MSGITRSGSAPVFVAAPAARRAGRRLGVAGLIIVAVLSSGCAAGPQRSGPSAPGSPPGTGVAAPSGPPVTVGLESANAGHRLVARVVVGGAPLRVMVDTGSSGLRVAADRVPASATTPVGPARSIAYGSGVSLTGTIVRTTVAVGPLTSTPAPVELVTATSCLPRKPQCEAAGGRRTEEFGGEFDGILGIGLANGEDAPNPLWYLGPTGHAFTIHHEPGGDSTMTLGAPSDGFSSTRLRPGSAAGAPADGPPSWVPRVDVCFAAATLPGGTRCDQTLLDTGNVGLATVNVPGAVPGRLTPGTSVRMTAPPSPWSADYVVGPNAAAQIGAPATGNPGSIAGLPFFARADVRFDLASGTVGLRSR